MIETSSEPMSEYAAKASRQQWPERTNPQKIQEVAMLLMGASRSDYTQIVT
jgi:hypothetical protein